MWDVQRVTVPSAGCSSGGIEIYLWIKTAVQLSPNLGIWPSTFLGSDRPLGEFEV